MKKYFVMLFLGVLCFVLMISLPACGDDDLSDDRKETAGITSDLTSDVTDEITASVTTEAETTVADTAENTTQEPEMPKSDLDIFTENYDKTVTLKKSYSDYVKTYTETVLLPFDEGDKGYIIQEKGYYDKEHSIDKNGALRWDIVSSKKNDNQDVLLKRKTGFSFDASDRNKSTLKFWLYVSETDNVVCDHDEGYGFQKNQATFYFRVVDKNGKTHAWNHTITNNGWHEIELSFNVHNGADADFDYSNVTGFGMFFYTYKNVTVMIDSLRGVVYSTDYIPSEIEGEKNPRLISDCEYDALDGAILQEWYGASYDLDDKVQGKSSLRNCGDATVNDFRTIIANLNVPMNKEKDVLVFSFKVADVSTFAKVLIELNEIQDQHEYQYTFKAEQLKEYGFGGENDTWYEVRIPLSAFNDNFKDPARGTKVTLRNFRFVMTAAGDKPYDYNVDHIYLCEK